METALFTPAIDENDQPRVAIIAAHAALLAAGDVENAAVLVAVLQQAGTPRLTDDMALAIYG